MSVSLNTKDSSPKTKDEKEEEEDTIAANSGDEKKLVCITTYQELFDVREQTTGLGRRVRNPVISKPSLQPQMNGSVNESGHAESILLQSHGLKSKENVCGDDK